MSSPDSLKARSNPNPLSDFQPPEDARFGACSLREILRAVREDDPDAVDALRGHVGGTLADFDAFVGATRRLASGDAAGAAHELGAIPSEDDWLVVSAVRVLALAAAGSLREAVGLYNLMVDRVGSDLRIRGASSSPSGYALLPEACRHIQLAETTAAGPLPPMAPNVFCVVSGYPRSGTTHLIDFLRFAFDYPTYTVYPGGMRYYSRRFHDPAAEVPFILKDHSIRDEYFESPIVAPVRDGRNVMLSFARFEYAEGHSHFARRGELADFMSWAATNPAWGFWGAHVERVLDARERGAQVQLARYELVTRDYSHLVELARNLAGGDPPANLREDDYRVHSERAKRLLSIAPGFSEGVALPDDSFIPRNWRVGADTNDWRTLFDRKAAQRFHDLGGTQALIRLGYETDEGWWRDC